jgi:hypothetical protein
MHQSFGCGLPTTLKKGSGQKSPHDVNKQSTVTAKLSRFTLEQGPAAALSGDQLPPNLQKITG